MSVPVVLICSTVAQTPHRCTSVYHRPVVWALMAWGGPGEGRTGKGEWGMVLGGEWDWWWHLPPRSQSFISGLEAQQGAFQSPSAKETGDWNSPIVRPTASPSGKGLKSSPPRIRQQVPAAVTTPIGSRGAYVGIGVPMRAGQLRIGLPNVLPTTFHRVEWCTKWERCALVCLLLITQWMGQLDS